MSTGRQSASVQITWEAPTDPTDPTDPTPINCRFQTINAFTREPVRLQRGSEYLKIKKEHSTIHSSSTNNLYGYRYLTPRRKFLGGLEFDVVHPEYEINEGKNTLTVS